MTLLPVTPDTGPDGIWTVRLPLPRMGAVASTRQSWSKDGLTLLASEVRGRLDTIAYNGNAPPASLLIELLGTPGPFNLAVLSTRAMSTSGPVTVKSDYERLQNAARFTYAPADRSKGPFLDPLADTKE